MKPFQTILLLAAMLFTLSAPAQSIQSLTVIPSNPTTADTIMLLASCTFPSGSCDQHTQFSSMNGNLIDSYALHCLGPLSVICNYTDTFIVNPLPAGNYIFRFQVDVGIGPVPCTPGFVPGPNDTIAFTVSPFVGVNEYISQDEISIFPNPVTNEFNVKGVAIEQYPLTLSIFSQEGKLVKQVSVEDEKTTISLNQLPNAMYQVRITKNNGENVIIPVLKQQ